MDVCRECCVLSGRGLCDELITRTEESYRLWCVVVFDLKTSWMRRPWPTGGCRAKSKDVFTARQTDHNRINIALPRASVPTVMEAGQATWHVFVGVEKRKCLAPIRVWNPRPSSPQLVYIRTTLSGPQFEILSTLNEAVHHVVWLNKHVAWMWILIVKLYGRNQFLEM
jgi:hypothetical protein